MIVIFVWLLYSFFHCEPAIGFISTVATILAPAITLTSTAGSVFKSIVVRIRIRDLFVRYFSVAASELVVDWFLFRSWAPRDVVDCCSTIWRYRFRCLLFSNWRRDLVSSWLFQFLLLSWRRDSVSSWLLYTLRLPFSRHRFTSLIAGSIFKTIVVPFLIWYLVVKFLSVTASELAVDRFLLRSCTPRNVVDCCFTIWRFNLRCLGGILFQINYSVPSIPNVVDCCLLLRLPVFILMKYYIIHLIFNEVK